MPSYFNSARALTVAGAVVFTMSAGVLSGCGGPPTTTTTTRTVTTDTTAPVTPQQQTTTVERQSTMNQ